MLKIRRVVSALGSLKTKGHFSQFGEDVVIHKIFPKTFCDGIYVDLGAFHPFYFSNTAYLWLKGWSGLNVDANPKSIEIFNKKRPNDINIFAAVVPEAVAASRTHVDLYTSPSQINTMGTCDEHLALERGQSWTVAAPTISLSTIFNKIGKHVDFLNIDIEGFDLAIINELPHTHMPTVICIEDYCVDIDAVMKSDISIKLRSLGYSFLYRLGPSSIFKLR